MNMGRGVSGAGARRLRSRGCARSRGLILLCASGPPPPFSFVLLSRLSFPLHRRHLRRHTPTPSPLPRPENASAAPAPSPRARRSAGTPTPPAERPPGAPTTDSAGAEGGAGGDGGGPPRNWAVAPPPATFPEGPRRRDWWGVHAPADTGEGRRRPGRGDRGRGPLRPVPTRPHQGRPGPKALHASTSVAPGDERGWAWRDAQGRPWRRCAQPASSPRTTLDLRGCRRRERLWLTDAPRTGGRGPGGLAGRATWGRGDLEGRAPTPRPSLSPPGEPKEQEKKRSGWEEAQK